MKRIVGIFLALFIASCANAGTEKLTMPEEEQTPAMREIGDTWVEPVTGMEFVWIPEGCFQMGGGGAPGKSRWPEYEGPVHEVCVDGFWMGRYEVTNAQYRKYRTDHDSRDLDGRSFNGHRQPVVAVSWDGAKAYASWLSQLSDDRYEFRLPSEAEWEYAARAGTKTSRHWGDKPGDACSYANVRDLELKRAFKWTPIHNCDDGYVETAPVGSFQPNTFGLHDMLGNVWEWCEDTYDRHAYSDHSRRNPIVTDGGSQRVRRGGSWYSRPREVRSAVRRSSVPEFGSLIIGFRLLRTSS